MVVVVLLLLLLVLLLVLPLLPLLPLHCRYSVKPSIRFFAEDLDILRMKNETTDAHFHRDRQNKCVFACTIRCQQNRFDLHVALPYFTDACAWSVRMHNSHHGRALLLPWRTITPPRTRTRAMHAFRVAARYYVDDVPGEWEVIEFTQEAGDLVFLPDFYGEPCF